MSMKQYLVKLSLLAIVFAFIDLIPVILLSLSGFFDNMESAVTGKKLLYAWMLFLDMRVTIPNLLNRYTNEKGMNTNGT